MSEHPLFTEPPHVRLHLAVFSMSLRLEMGHRHPTRLRQIIEVRHSNVSTMNVRA
jgi:hypothetical protein